LTLSCIVFLPERRRNGKEVRNHAEWRELHEAVVLVISWIVEEQQETDVITTGHILELPNVHGSS
jgi:hypothetical protein